MRYISYNEFGAYLSQFLYSVICFFLHFMDIFSIQRSLDFSFLLSIFYAIALSTPYRRVFFLVEHDDFVIESM